MLILPYIYIFIYIYNLVINLVFLKLEISENILNLCYNQINNKFTYYTINQ